MSLSSALLQRSNGDVKVRVGTWHSNTQHLLQGSARSWTFLYFQYFFPTELRKHLYNCHNEPQEQNYKAKTEVDSIA